MIIAAVETLRLDAFPNLLFVQVHTDDGLASLKETFYGAQTVRAYYMGWYRGLVTALPAIERGYIAPPPGPGLGTALRPDLAARPDAHLRETALESSQRRGI